jgi:hypothetical protein
MQRPFYGNPNLLAIYRARMAAHIAADELVQGIGFDSARGMGCFVGCSLDAYDHEQAADETAIPIQIWHLCDAIHEGLPNRRVAEFATRFYAEVNLNSDASLWWSRFAIELMTNPEHGVVRYMQGPGIANDVAALYKRRIVGDEPSLEEWAAAEFAGWSGQVDADDIAKAAGRVVWTTARAADDVGEAVEEAVWTAAWIAAQVGEDDIWTNAQSDHYIWQAETLLKIIAE